jgi:CheY-like chemotaxis protein
MDGYAVARELQGKPKVRSALMVALTGYGRAEDRERTRAAGFHQHLTKPVTRDQLDALLAGREVSSRPL